VSKPNTGVCVYKLKQELPLMYINKKKLSANPENIYIKGLFEENGGLFIKNKVKNIFKELEISNDMSHLLVRDRSSENFYNSVGFLGVSDILLLEEDYMHKLFYNEDSSP
jgi:hypothetical protein